MRGMLLLGITLLCALVPSAPAQEVDPLFPSPLPSEVRPVSGIQPPPPPEFPAPKKDNNAPGPVAPIYTEPKAPTPPNIPLPAMPVPNAPQAVPIQTAPGQPPFIAPPPTPAPEPSQNASVLLSVRPRYSGALQVQYKPLEDGMTAIVVTGGVNLQIISGNSTDKKSFVDIEADRLVIWTRSNAQQMFSNLRNSQESNNGAHEFYLSGNVELRTRSKLGNEDLRADEVYYDTRRSVAVARKADLTIWQAKFASPIHVQMEEWIRESPERSKANTASIFASVIPSDPGLRADINDFTIQERKIEKRRFFGLIPAYDKDGKQIIETQHIFTGNDTVFRIEGWPVFYFPYLRGRVEDPLGPLDSLGFNYNRIYGFMFNSTWDLFDIFGLDHVAGQRWQLYVDYMSKRGLGYGTQYELAGDSFLGMKAKTNALIRLYGMNDSGLDILGGDRGQNQTQTANTPIPINHPDYRGWANGKLNVQGLPEGFSVLGQFSFISDRNYLEEYYLPTHLNDLNQDTYLYVKQQQENWAWNLMGSVRTREWMTETEWLPKADGHLIGQTFGLPQFEDLFVYSARASVGYARLKPTSVIPYAYLPTDVRVDTGRFDLFQEISMPFYAGPVKFAPYLNGDLAYYTQDVNGDPRGRLYGGAGVRASLPLSRQYPDIHSELFNVNGIYHKLTLTGNYYNAQSSSSLNNFPQLDRLNDDVTDQALRDIRPWQQNFNPLHSSFLTSSSLFNPQNYALRRLIDNRSETLDTIDVLQMGLRQRWQTKRGMPGEEHVVDWMTLNLGASLFPHSNRDNYGNTVGIVEYDWLWNIGDRTALSSSGWTEPFAGGPRAFDFGAFINRPDSTNLYLGYRQIDPLNSKSVIAAVTYPFSGKYAMTASTVWDFGVDVRTYSLMLTRMGTDLLVGIGVNYNSTLHTVGVNFEVVPNLARRPTGRTGALFPTTASNDLSVVR